MTKHKQTWWDKEIKNQFEDFKSWVGSPSAYTKAWARKFILSNKYKSVIDIGCGMCDDYFLYKDTEIHWQGVDGSEFLVNRAIGEDIPVSNFQADDIILADSTYDVSYSRHVLEHQAKFNPVLNEMIRLADQVVINIFFIKPRDKEIINYNSDNNLYHNTYDKKEIESFLESHPKVRSYSWEEITEIENALIINLI